MLAEAYISNEIPVLIWVTIGMKESKDGMTYLLEDGTPYTCLLIILTIIGSVGKHRTDAYLRIEFLEYLVVAKQHGDRLYGKQSVEISIVGRFVEVVEDKSEHTRFVSTRRHGSRNRPFGDFQCVTGSTGTGAEVDGS